MNQYNVLIVVASSIHISRKEFLNPIIINTSPICVLKNISGTSRTHLISQNYETNSLEIARAMLIK